MMPVLRVGGAILVLLVVIEAAAKPSFLPLGGSDVIQMAVVLALAFVLSEMIDVIWGKNDARKK